MVTSYSGQDSWTFTTIHEPMYGDHPVSGNRDFGYIWNPDGTYTFYTKGVDRLTTWDASSIQDVTKFPFNKAKDLWTSFQNHIANFVSQNSGNASIVEPQTYQPNWNTVKDL